MPIARTQVKAGLDPQRFTIRTAPAFLKKTKPWSDYDRVKQDLRDAAVLGCCSAKIEAEQALGYELAHPPCPQAQSLIQRSIPGFYP